MNMPTENEPFGHARLPSAAQLRLGYTTGTCAATATKAAALAWFRQEQPDAVQLTLPNGEFVELTIETVQRLGTGARACVRKDAGDDPDVTHDLLVCVELRPISGNEVRFLAGEGVGCVTLPGLGLAPGEPAINPAPRRQIVAALREVTADGAELTVSIPGGRAIAEKTFNPRLGIEGGLSILGTDGRVRPFSHERRQAAIVLGLDVAFAQGVVEPVLVPGHQGRRHALARLDCPPLTVVEAGNDFGVLLARCVERKVSRVLLLGHPGKLGKLASGEFDTHSSRSRSALDPLANIARSLGIELGQSPTTTEGAFALLGEALRHRLGNALAHAIAARTEGEFPSLSCAVWLNNLRGEDLGQFGDMNPWIH